jgi:hypothetical protein
MTVHEGELYVGGDFSSVPGSTSSFGRVARWDGSAWQPVGDGPQLSGPVHALASSGTKLVAVGKFLLAGGVTANRVAAWDGADWLSFGDGSDAPVHAVAGTADGFWIGGDFQFVDGKGSPYFGHWSEVVTIVPPAAVASAKVQLGDPYPNPFNPSVTVDYVLDMASRVELTIFDAAGRRVRALARGEARPAGSYTALWDGRTDGGTHAASGVYYLQLRAGEATATRRLVLLK